MRYAYAGMEGFAATATVGLAVPGIAVGAIPFESPAISIEKCRKPFRLTTFFLARREGYRNKLLLRLLARKMPSVLFSLRRATPNRPNVFAFAKNSFGGWEPGARTRKKMSTCSSLFLAGMEGFEPPNAWTRTTCLTTWRHPNTYLSTLKSIANRGQAV